MPYNRLERNAEESFYLGRPTVYDLTIDEIYYLRDIIRGSADDTGIYKAITTAFCAGFLRGHRATARGRIPTKKRTVTRSK